LDIHGLIQEIHQLEPLLEQLLQRLCKWIPAEYAASLFAAGTDGELQTVAAFGTARSLNAELMHESFVERTAVLLRTPTSILCAPLGNSDRHFGVVYLQSPAPDAFDLEHLHLLAGIAGIVAPALAQVRHAALLETENQGLRDYAYIEHGIVGNTPPIREIRNFVGRVAPSDSTILILGESGTGKELVARGIHKNSRRSNGPFMAVNCAAIVDTLVESELFGHERGAFTGATAQKKGKVELADAGTLFLDEVGELSLKTQAALLRFLQEREFQRVGGSKTLRADVRVVAATNRNMQQWIEAGQFRHDLYYRLQVLEVRTPSLSEIREDIPPLAEHFLKRFRYIRVVSGISPNAMESLMAYDWPGNVRQLQNAIEHALVYGRDNLIEPDDLPSSVRTPNPSYTSAGFEARVADFKRGLVESALAEASGDFEIAAARLKLTSSYLYRLARQLNVKR
jgi:Nif-specific regulatory protein